MRDGRLVARIDVGLVFFAGRKGHGILQERGPVLSSGLAGYEFEVRLIGLARAAGKQPGTTTCGHDKGLIAHFYAFLDEMCVIGAAEAVSAGLHAVQGSTPEASGLR